MTENKEQPKQDLQQLGVPADRLEAARKLAETGHTDFAVPSVKDCRTEGEDNLTKPLGFVSCPANQGKLVDRDFCSPDRCPFSFREYSTAPMPNHATEREVVVKNYPWPDELQVVFTEVLTQEGKSVKLIAEVKKLTLYCLRPKIVNELVGWQEDKA